MPVHYSCYQSITTGFHFFFFFSKIDLSNNCYQSITVVTSPLQLAFIFFSFFSKIDLSNNCYQSITVVTSPLQLAFIFFFSFFRKLTWVTIVTSALQSVMPVHYSCCQSITTGFSFFSFSFFWKLTRVTIVTSPLQSVMPCPEWNEGMEDDEKVLHWLSQNAGLTSECVAEVIELFARQWSENAISGKTWNEAAKHAAVKQVSQPPPRSIKAVELTTVPSHGTFEQYTLLNWLSDTAKAQTRPSDDAMIVDEPAKPVAGSSKHPDNTDIIDGELIY